jgi:hypothetical protein
MQSSTASVLYILIFKFLGKRQEDKKLRTER